MGFLSLAFIPSSVIAVGKDYTSAMPVDRTNSDGSPLGGQVDKKNRDPRLEFRMKVHPNGLHPLETVTARVAESEVVTERQEVQVRDVRMRWSERIDL